MSGLGSPSKTGTRYYIEQDDPHAAISVDERIKERTEMLVQFPECGRQGRIEGTRELVISRTPHIVAYRILDGTVYILRVLHGAQAWPDDIPFTKLKFRKERKAGE